MTTETETGVGSSKPRKAWSPEKLEEARKDFSLSLQRERDLADTDFGLLASGTVREYISLILNHRVPSRLLQHTQKTKRHVLGILSIVNIWRGWVVVLE